MHQGGGVIAFDEPIKRAAVTNSLSGDRSLSDVDVLDQMRADRYRNFLIMLLHSTRARGAASLRLLGV